MSTFDSTGIGLGVSYEFLQNGWWKLDRGSVSFGYERKDDEETFTLFWADL